MSYQRHRGLQLEAIAALPALWLDRMGVLVYRKGFQFGSQQIFGPGVFTITLLSSLVMVLAVIAVTVAATVRSRRQSLDFGEALLLATALITVLIVTNKVFSPQYLLWLLAAYGLLCADSRWAERRLTFCLLTTCLLSHVLFPYLYPRLVEHELVPIAILTLRDLLVLYFAIRIWRHTFIMLLRPLPGPKCRPSLRRWRRPLPIATAAMAEHQTGGAELWPVNGVSPPDFHKADAGGVFPESPLTVFCRHLWRPVPANHPSKGVRAQRRIRGRSLGSG